MKKVCLILACTFDGGIGYKDKIPWVNREEMAKFRKITTECQNGKTNAVIMGRKTWESLNQKPLKDRINVVLTSNKKYKSDDCIVRHDIKNAIQYCDTNPIVDTIFIIGGARIYDECICYHSFDIYLSVMFDNDAIADTFIDMEKIFSNYIIKKDLNFSIEHDNRSFASYICSSKKSKKIL